MAKGKLTAHHLLKGVENIQVEHGYREVDTSLKQKTKAQDV